jgi:hypothetical protein
MRNTLIVDLTNRSNQVDFQRLHNDTLAGHGPFRMACEAGGIGNTGPIFEVEAAA